MEFTVAKDVAALRRRVSRQGLQAQTLREFQRFGLVVEKAVDAPFAGVTLRRVFRPDLAAGAP